MEMCSSAKSYYIVILYRETVRLLNGKPFKDWKYFYDSVDVDLQQELIRH